MLQARCQCTTDFLPCFNEKKVMLLTERCILGNLGRHSSKDIKDRAYWNSPNSAVFACSCIRTITKIHRWRNLRYSFQVDLDHGSSTLQFLKFWNQNVVNILFLVVKSLEVTSGFISKLMKKNSRWRHHWNIWHLSVKTKISPLFGFWTTPEMPGVSKKCAIIH